MTRNETSNRTHPWNGRKVKHSVDDEEREREADHRTSRRAPVQVSSYKGIRRCHVFGVWKRSQGKVSWVFLLYMGTSELNAHNRTSKHVQIEIIQQGVFRPRTEDRIVPLVATISRMILRVKSLRRIKEMLPRRHLAAHRKRKRLHQAKVPSRREFGEPPAPAAELSRGVTPCVEVHRASK